MQLGSFSIYLTALVLLTMTSSTLGAAIDLSSSPSKRDLGGFGNGGEIWKNEMLKRDDAGVTTNTGKPGGSVGDNIVLAVRVAGEDEEGNNELSRKRWYTLVEIGNGSDSSDSE